MSFTEDLIDEALGIERERPEGIPLDERLRMAFPNGVPKEVREVFAFTAIGAPKASHIAEMFKPQAARYLGVDPVRQDNSARYIAEVEARLAQLQADHASVCTELDRPQINFGITAEDLGVKLMARMGGERLIADFTAELERLKAGAQEKFDGSQNRCTLFNLAKVIGGEMEPDVFLAHDLGYESVSAFVQGFYPDWKLQQMAKAQAEAEEAARIRAEASKQTHAAWASEVSETEQKDRAVIAMVDAMDIAGVIKYLYGESDRAVALTACTRGPGSLPSSEAYEEYQRTIFLLKSQSQDSGRKRAYERLSDALREAHHGPRPKSWEFMKEIAANG